jgi:hypothetical protein
MIKLSETMMKWRSRSTARSTDPAVDTAEAPAVPDVATKSPEFQRRAARAMGKSAVAWSG